MRRRAWLGSALLAAMLASPAAAQQVALPSGNASSVQPGISSGSVNIPQTNLAPVPTTAPPAGASPFAPAPFDPYAIQPGQRGNFATTPAVPSTGGALGASIGPPIVVPQPNYGSIPPSPPGSSLFSRLFSRPAGYPTYPAPTYGAAAPGYGAPPSAFAAPPSAFGAPVPSYGAANTGQPSLPPLYQAPAPGPYNNPNVYGPPIGYTVPDAGIPSSAYPAPVPSTLFPNGVIPGGSVIAQPFYTAQRFLQGPRLRHGYVASTSNDPTSLAMNDTDLSAVFAFNNFLYSPRPLYVVPSFSLHLWDGPGPGKADLPSKAYSAFLDVGWNSDANQMVSTEFGVRVGMFSDFDTSNSDSIRILGKGLVSFRWTPQWTFKAGLYYLDRNSVKLVPAGGFLWQPSPFTRVDLFFPQPRLSRFWRTVGTRDVWWYLAGDYGGGSWTIKRTNGDSDSVDINDLRAVLGIEWGMPDAIRAGRRSGFFEVGYVFNRKIKYRKYWMDNIDPKDGIMFRAGIGY